MRAAIFNAPHEMEIGEWQDRTPGPGEVRVSVGATGICAGDMYIYLGRNPYAKYPVIGGHEIAGVVVEVGEGVTGFEPGMRVVVEPFIGCGSCYPCRVNKPNCCANLYIIGIHGPGGFAESVTAPAANIHVIPENLSMSDASFAEPVAIGVQACRRGNVSEGEDVLILGCGPIGLALIEVAKARGANVLASDIYESRLEFAAHLGAEPLPSDENLLSRVMERTNGEGMPVVIEATGNVKAMESTVDLVAAGGRIVIVGLVKQGLGVTLPGLDFTRKEMTIVGSRASTNCFPESLELLARGAITYPRVATEFDMWDAPRVFTDLAENPGMVHKGVLVRDRS
ncbi:MAG: alcohol dehydrogenase catalytic domain-containing protein [Armatimonadetes bacterium]|nr:alcohol dehydrogenase catalytic domain-containing protein [Armatimonadota bacterium]